MSKINKRKPVWQEKLALFDTDTERTGFISSNKDVAIMKKKIVILSIIIGIKTFSKLLSIIKWINYCKFTTKIITAVNMRTGKLQEVEFEVLIHSNRRNSPHLEFKYVLINIELDHHYFAWNIYFLPQYQHQARNHRKLEKLLRF